MEGPPIIRLNNQVEAAAQRLHRQFDAGAIVVGVAESPDGGGFGIAWRVEGVTPGQHERALLELLRGLSREIEAGVAAGCPDCIDRHERVGTAIAALAAGFGPDGQQPVGSC